MSIDGIRAADAIADAFWWLRGFTSAQPDNAGAFEATASAQNAHRWLQGVIAGHSIVIRAEQGRGDKEGYRIVISEAEFERMRDGLRGSDADRADGRAVADGLVNRAHAEIKGILDPKLPF